jgi:hypothetical protein
MVSAPALRITFGFPSCGTQAEFAPLSARHLSFQLSSHDVSKIPRRIFGGKRKQVRTKAKTAELWGE